MWRKILLYAIKAAVASGLGEKAIEWLKGKVAKHVMRLEKRVNSDLDAIEKAAGPIEVEVD